MEFLIVDNRSTYHGVLRQSALKELWVATSVHHFCMKVHTDHGIATIQSIK